MARRSTPTKKRRGIALVFVTVFLVVLIGFAAFAIDVGHVCAVCTEMQNTADGAALAGASALRDELGGETESRARDVIADNLARLGYGNPDDSIIQIGKWNSVTGEFTEAAVDDGAFAVRVVARRPKTPYFFAPVFGKNSTTVTREAIAVGSGPCGGIWGLNGVKAGSINTDSYNSNDGPYDPLTSLDNGDVCSGRDIKVNGSFDIQGDVMAGFGYEVTVAGNAGDITGITTNRVDATTAPPVDFTDVKLSNDNSTIGLTSDNKSPWKGAGYNLDIQAQAYLTLDPGTYLLDSIKLGGGAQIVVTGPTTIYVSGDIDAIGGTIVNKTNDPHDLTILSGGSSVKISGGAGFYGSILAPDADVALGGTADYYGAVVGGTVTLGGDFTFHVDESLDLSNWWTPPPIMLVR